MIRYLFALIVAGSMFFQVQPVFSQSAEELKALKDEVKSLKDGQDGIKKDILDIFLDSNLPILEGYHFVRQCL